MGHSPPEICIRLLRPDDDRSGFHCGQIDLDRFFQRYAGQNQFRHHIGTTYVAELKDRIHGFVTVTVGELAGEKVAQTLRRRLPAYPIPILRVTRLAVDSRWQRQGVGRLLLKGMFELALELRDRVGCTGVVVDAKSEAVDFYGRLGFAPLAVSGGMLGDRPEPMPMFLPIRVIAKAPS